VILISISLVFVSRMSEMDVEYGRDDVSFGAHLKKFVVASPFLFVGYFLRARWLRKNAWLIYVIVIAMLIAVPLIGVDRNNARRWIALPLAGFDLQPSELAKIGLILVLARVLYRNHMQRLQDWVLPCAVAILPMLLVMSQPDLGTALTIVPVALGMFWLAGARGSILISLCMAGMIFGAMAYQNEWVQGYQHKRIEVWINCYQPENLIEQRNGLPFHTYMAHTSIGNGGTWGTGLGKGVANEAGHLPERDCDSVFAVIAEEGGFAGAAGIVGLYFLYSTLMLAAAARTRERFAKLVVGGVGLFFAAHFFINVGVNLGLVPMTGLTLPLVSTGGSSLMASFSALGLALGLSARQERSLDMDAFSG
jgi:rod shape determining protein RodA